MILYYTKTHLHELQGDTNNTPYIIHDGVYKVYNE